MTLVLIASLPNGTLQNARGDAQSGGANGTATFRNLDGTAPLHLDGSLVTHYADAAGTDASTAAITADSRGRLMRYIAGGTYKQIVNGESIDFHAVSGSVESRPAKLSITEPRFGAAAAADGIWNQGAIQAALDYAGGDGIWLPPDETFTTGFLEVEDDYKITGAGMGRSALRAMDALAVGNPLGTGLIQPRAFATTTVRRVTLRDLKLLGNSVGQNGGGPLLDSSGTLHGFNGRGVEYCLAERVWFEDFDGDGWYIGRGLASQSPSAANKNQAVGCVFTLNVRNGSMLSDGEFNVWDRCYFIANQQGLNPASPKFGGAFYLSAELDIEPNGSGQVANHNRIANCFFLNGWTRGIQLARSRPIIGNKILGCYFRDNLVQQIVAVSESIQDLEIAHNHFEATVPANVDCHLRAGQGNDFRITENTFRGGTSGDGSASAVMIDDAGTIRPQRPILRDNLFDVAGGVGNGNRIYLFNADDAEVGNTWVGTPNFVDSGARTKYRTKRLKGTVVWDAPLMGAGTGRNEQQTISHNGTGGTGTLTWNGQTTAAINWNETFANIQLALEALSNIEPGDILVSGGPWPAAVRVEFIGPKGGQNQAAITGSAASLTPGGSAFTITTVTDGAPSTASTTISVPGAALGDVVAGVSASVNLGAAGLDGVVTAADTVTATITNTTGSVINPNNATYTALVDKLVA